MKLRREYQAALNLQEPADAYTILGRWAACEFRAGQTERAEELVAQAKDEGAVGAGRRISDVGGKRPAEAASQRQGAFRQGVQGRAGGAAHGGGGGGPDGLDEYSPGQRGRLSWTEDPRQEMVAYVEKASGNDFTESQMERVCADFGRSEIDEAAHRFLERRRQDSRPIRFSPIGLAEMSMMRGPAYYRPSR